MRHEPVSRTLPSVLDILVLALGAAFYPTLLAIVVVALTRPKPARLLSAYLIGGMLTALAIGFIVVFALNGIGVKTSRTPTTEGAILDIVAGALSLGFAALLASGRVRAPESLRRRRAERAMRDADKPSWTTRAIAHDSTGLAFGLGVILNLPSLWYLIALKDIATGPYSKLEQVLLILMFNVIMFALIEIPLIAYLLAPDRAAARVEGAKAWTRAHARALAQWVAVALGVYLVVKGVIAL